MCALTNRWSERVEDKVPSSNICARVAQLEFMAKRPEAGQRGVENVFAWSHRPELEASAGIGGCHPRRFVAIDERHAIAHSLELGGIARRDDDRAIESPKLREEVSKQVERRGAKPIVRLVENDYPPVRENRLRDAKSNQRIARERFESLPAVIVERELVNDLSHALARGGCAHA